MYYVIFAQDVENSLPMRVKARDKHIARLNDLKEQGRLLMAGPLPAIDSEEPGVEGFTGSLVVAEFDSLQVAQNWAEADPYFESGAYDSATVKPFKKVLP